MALAAVERQELLAGARLPPERLLAVRLDIARSTLGAAYRLLAALPQGDQRPGDARQRRAQLVRDDGKDPQGMLLTGGA